MKKSSLLILISLLGVPLFAQQLTESEEVRIVKEFLNAVSSKNREVTHQLLDESVVWNQPGNNVLSGKKKSATEVFAMSEQMHKLSQGTFHLKDFKILGVNGNQIVCQLHFTAVRPEGAWLDVQNTDVYSIGNGKITHAQIFSGDLQQEDYFWGK